MPAQATPAKVRPGGRGDEGSMFQLGYALNELRRRLGRTLVTALGLAAGVGLVVGIIGVSNGLTNAQNKVLSPLSSVGTDIIVTRTVAPTNTSAGSSSSSSSSSGGGLNGEAAGFFAAGGGAGAQLAKLNASDDASLLDSNSSVLTDLAKLGPAGTNFIHDFFVPGTLITFPQAAVQDVESVQGVESATPGLSMQALHETGTVPKITATVQTGGQTINQLENLPPLTAAQAVSVRNCIVQSPEFSSIFGGGSGGFNVASLGPLLQQCLPADYQSFVAHIIVPALTIEQVINPPMTNTQTSSYSVAGVNPKSPDSGLITTAQLVKGSWFGSSPADQVLVSKSYASTKGIKVGQPLTINNMSFDVVGLVNPTLTGSASDIYFDLNTLQSQASSPGRINEVLVKVANSSDVNAVAARIRKKLPGAQVLTDTGLANSVTGSLANAHSLANHLGGVLALIILLAAFLIAALLTLSNISKRVREIGTLRALGWSRGRVVRQIIAETLGIGILGAVLGVALGIGVCAAIGAYGPRLTSTSSGATVAASNVGSLFGQATTASVKSVTHLAAPITGSTILIGILVALVGGLVAGAAGGWRASRMAPAEALADVG